MYDTREIEQLAHDEEFAAEVRRTAADLFPLAATAAPNLAGEIGPMMTYGPAQPATLLGMKVVPIVLAALARNGEPPEPDLVERAFQILERLDTARV